MFVLSEDPVAAAKAVKKFAKDNEKITILGGAMGEEIMDQLFDEKLAREVQLADRETMGAIDASGRILPNA